jgi:alpha-D-ribose 1-methylphosphonate 5-phosphate C-P lyase
MESLYTFNIEWARLLQIKLFEEIKNDKELDNVYDILHENYVMYSKAIGKFDFPYKQSVHYMNMLSNIDFRERIDSVRGGTFTEELDMFHSFEDLHTFSILLLDHNKDEVAVWEIGLDYPSEELIIERKL